MLRLGLILMIICLAASLVLAATYKLTAPAIEAQKTSQEKQALKDVLTQADEFKELHAAKFDYYKGFKNKISVGYVLKVKAKGYSGDIDMLVGIDANGIIQAIEVLSQQETPGLGSRTTEVKKDEKKPWFLEQFKGKLAMDLKMSDIQAISGATISSSAVLESVKQNVKDFLEIVNK